MPEIKFFGIGILSWVTWLPAVGAIMLLFFSKAKERPHPLVCEPLDRSLLSDFHPARHRAWLRSVRI